MPFKQHNIDGYTTRKQQIIQHDILWRLDEKWSHSDDNYDVTTTVAAATTAFDDNGFRDQFRLSAQDERA